MRAAPFDPIARACARFADAQKATHGSQLRTWHCPIDCLACKSLPSMPSVQFIVWVEYSVSSSPTSSQHLPKEGTPSHAPTRQCHTALPGWVLSASLPLRPFGFRLVDPIGRLLPIRSRRHVRLHWTVARQTKQYDVHKFTLYSTVQRATTGQSMRRAALPAHPLHRLLVRRLGSLMLSTASLALS